MSALRLPQKNLNSKLSSLNSQPYNNEAGDDTMNGRVALVTGGARGIGRAIALKLASLGANVAVLDAGSLETTEQTAEEIRALYADFTRKRYGRIVNIASIAGLMGNAGQANYAASKAGVVGLTKTIARELASRGVTCNAVAPGFIETSMTANMNQAALEAASRSIPVGRMGKPEDVAAAVAFLAGDDAGYITGTVLNVDGGFFMR